MAERQGFGICAWRLVLLHGQDAAKTIKADDVASGDASSRGDGPK
jgi:hypothetical protein